MREIKIVAKDKYFGRELGSVSMETDIDIEDIKTAFLIKTGYSRLTDENKFSMFFALLEQSKEALEYFKNHFGKHILIEEIRE